MDWDDVADVIEHFPGVRVSQNNGHRQWRFRGRLVARQIDDTRLVIRCEFEARDALLSTSPRTFSVPVRFRKHMMIVADLAGGDDAVIEDALAAAFDLQQRAE